MGKRKFRENEFWGCLVGGILGRKTSGAWVFSHQAH